jgi:arginyl-tRNA--protein-N-Asp/Glu arginylyltransferase
VEARLRFVAPPVRCEYLPGQMARLEYLQVDRMSAGEYQEWLRRGWRRFGHVLFRPACPTCRQCLSLRVPVASFEPHRTQRRIARANTGVVTIDIGEPSPSPDTRALYDKFHHYQQGAKGWPAADPEGADVFVVNPFSTEEWRYWLDGRLVAVGYVDVLPDGLSAVYFFYDPDERRRSLGTFNVLSIIESARRRGVEWAYLGYYVRGCRSLEYKAQFRPNEILHADGMWGPFVRG